VTNDYNAKQRLLFDNRVFLVRMRVLPGSEIHTGETTDSKTDLDRPEIRH